MPRTAVTPQAASAVGSTPTFEAANVLGNMFTPARGRAIHIKNGSGSTITITVPTPGVADVGLAIPDRTFTIAAGATGVFGPGSAGVSGLYQTTGVVHVDYSAVTTVTVAVIDHP